MNRVCVIATGDRHADWQTWRPVVRAALTDDGLKGRAGVLIHGDARGIDGIAGKIAGMHGWAVVPVAANWKEDGAGAGPARNRAMLKIGETLAAHGYELRVYAFHDDLWGSKGTRNMVEAARSRGVPVTIHTTEG